MSQINSNLPSGSKIDYTQIKAYEGVAQNPLSPSLSLRNNHDMRAYLQENSLPYRDTMEHIHQDIAKALQKAKTAETKENDSNQKAAQKTINNYLDNTPIKATSVRRNGVSKTWDIPKSAKKLFKQALNFQLSNSLIKSNPFRDKRLMREIQEETASVNFLQGMTSKSLMPTIWLNKIKEHLENNMPQEYKILESPIQEIFSDENLEILNNTQKKALVTHFDN